VRVRPARSALCLLGLPCLLLGALACDTTSKSTGEMVISIETDMALPQQVDTLRVSVLVRGAYLQDTPYAVGGVDDYHVPATLTLQSGGNAALPVTVRVAGSKQGHLRTFRELVTTVPNDRSALLRMPLQWLCEDMVKSVTMDDGSGVMVTHAASSCDDGNTCIQGSCVPNKVNSDDLPSFAAREVFGGSDNPAGGSCFETVACMIKGVPVETSGDGSGDCTIDKPAGAKPLNVALRVAGDGICDSSGTVCFVPLDADSSEGWSESGSQLKLPPAVCKKRQSGQISAVYVSDQCAPKTADIPPCGTWSSVPSDHAILPQLAGTPARATASLLISLPTDGGAAPCCPLTQDAGKLYTCMCDPDSQTSATLFEIDLSGPSVKSLGDIELSPKRQEHWFSARAWNGSLYWSAPPLRQIERTLLQGSSTAATSYPLPGTVSGLYESAWLLADSSAIYTLISGVSKTSPVQVLSLGKDGKFKSSFDTGGTQAVYQFAQDDKALYVAVRIDPNLDMLANDQAFMRTSRVVQLDKVDMSQHTNVLPDRTVQMQDKQPAHLQHGGYVGVQVDGSLLYALFENAPASDNTVQMELVKLDLSQPGAAASTVYQVNIDPAATVLSLLGVVDGSALLARSDGAVDGQGNTASVSSSSVIAVAKSDSSPRILAVFSHDQPVPALAVDTARIYWLNSLGRLYGLSRTALQ
jgi:hypothetical protein